MIKNYHDFTVRIDGFDIYRVLLTYTKDDQEDNVNDQFSQGCLDMEFPVSFGIFCLSGGP